MPIERAAQRGDAGLTTLSWLLITAAVAALAALAVALVTSRAQDVAARVASREAHFAAAADMASSVEADARAAPAADFDSWVDWERHFALECGLIAVLFADAGVDVVGNSFTRATGGTAFDTAAAGHAAAGDERPSTPARAQVRCQVGRPAARRRWCARRCQPGAPAG